MLEWLARVQLRFPKLLFAVFVVLLILIGAAAIQLEIDPSFASLVGKESEYNTNDRILTNAFGRNDAILLIIKEDPNTILSNARRVSDLDDYYLTLEETVAQSQYLEEITGPILSDDQRYAQYILTLYAPESPDGFKRVLAEMKSLVSQSGIPPGIIVEVTGLPILLDRVSTLLITDNLITVLLTLVFIFLILWFYARDLLFAAIALTVPLTSLITLAAVMAILDVEVTITLAAVGVLALGLGADYSIHMATHYRDARRHHENHEKAILHTIDELKVPITASFLTTLGGFAALIFGVSPSSQAQGIVLSLAITIIYVNSFLLFPMLLTLFGQNPGKPNPWMAKIRGFLARVAIFQARRYKLVLVIVFLLTIFMIIGASRVEFNTSNSNWIPDDDPVSSSFREINYVFGDSESLSIILLSTKGDLRNVQTARDVKRIVAYLETMPGVDSVSNPYGDVAFDSGAVYDHVTGNPDFNTDYTISTIVISTQNPNQDDEGNSLLLQNTREVVDRFPVHNADTLLYGDAVRFDELGDSLQRDAGVTTVLGLGIVFFIASAIYASVTIGLLAMVPIVVAVIWAVGLMGWLGVPFTSLSTGIVSLVLGVGVDFSIHLVDGIRRKIKLGIEKAITLTMESAGSAILLSSVTTFIGFMALTLARLLGTQRLGYSLALSILAVFVVTMMVVPAVMAATNKKSFSRRKKK